MSDEMDRAMPAVEGEPVLSEGWTPVNWITAVSCLSPEGELRFFTMRSGDINGWEQLGMAHALMMEAEDNMQPVDATYGEDD